MVRNHPCQRIYNCLHWVHSSFIYRDVGRSEFGGLGCSGGGKKGRTVIDGSFDGPYFGSQSTKIWGGEKGVVAPLSPRPFGPDSFIIWRGQEQGLLKDVRAKKNPYRLILHFIQSG